MTRRRPPRSRCAIALLAVGLVLAAAPATTPAADGEEPLTNVDVVRRVLAGVSENELVEWIRTSPSVAFDVTDEMRDELGIAGVPAAVIQAMVERQAEFERAQHPPEEQAEEAIEAALPPGLTLRLNPDRDPADGPTMLRLMDLVPPPLKVELGLREEPARFTDLALFLGCRTADHVPDHWRTQTPLGRDFVGSPRHRLLAFVSGAETLADKELAARFPVPDGVDPARLLELELPEEIAVELDPDVAHDLSLGIAFQTENRFYLYIFEDLDGLVLTERLTRDVRLSSGKNPWEFEFGVEWLHDAAPIPEAGDSD